MKRLLRKFIKQIDKADESKMRDRIIKNPEVDRIKKCTNDIDKMIIALEERIRNTH